jgi:hypothetical protein
VLDFTYDGFLPHTETWTLGAASHTVTKGYAQRAPQGGRRAGSAAYGRCSRPTRP